MVPRVDSDAIVQERSPGGAVPAPAVIPTTPFEAARARLLSLLRAGERPILLTGDAGTGKSLLLRAIEAELGAEGREVRRLDRGDLLGPEESAEIILVDEAARTDPETVADLLGRGVLLVLALLPDDIERLGLPDTAPTIILERLSAAEAHEFLAHHPRLKGRPIRDGARDAIVHAAQGLPRWLAVLAGAAVMEADLDGSEMVERRHAGSAIEMHHLSFAPVAVDEPAIPSPSADPQPVPVPGPLIADGAADGPRLSPSDALAEVEAPPVKVVRRLPIAAAVALLVAGSGIGVLIANLPILERQEEPVPRPVAEVQRTAPPQARTMPTAPPDAGKRPVAAVPKAPPSPAAATTPVPPPVEVAAAPAPAEPPAAETPVPVVPEPPVVIIEYSRNTPGASDAADRLVALLRARGHDVRSKRVVPGPITMAETRYPAGVQDAAAAVENDVVNALRAYQPDTRSQLAEAGGTREIVVRMPDAAASAARPLHLDSPPPK